MKVKIIILLATTLSAALAQQCAPDEFTCNNGNCIPGYWVCDGYDDCGDNSDEPGNPQECPPCEEGEWQCNNGRCIYDDYVCNGNNDCNDASDEQQDCPPCNNDMHQCANGVCVAPGAVCDGWDHCGDGSDEADENGKCPDCPAVSFVCPSSGRCIPEPYACNGENDCGDWGDENEDACPCTDDEIRCSKQGDVGPPGACIPPEWICDEEGIWDCPLGEDEANCTVNSEIKKNYPVHSKRPLKRKGLRRRGT